MIKAKRDYFKVQFAIFFAYNGSAYHGSQCQKDPSIKTVEREIFDSLLASKLVSEKHMGEIIKAGWGRAARTDRGVHALSNGVTMMLSITEDYLLHQSKIDNQDEQEQQQILQQEQNQNESEIKLENEQQEGKQVQDSNEVEFENEISQNIPQQNEQICSENQEIKEESTKQTEEEKQALQAIKSEKRKKRKQLIAEERIKSIDKEKIITVMNSNLPSDVRVVAVKQVVRKFDIRVICNFRFYEYIIPQFVFQKEGVPTDEAALIQRIKNIASQFKGTHNFHNYTTMMRAKDPKCTRYIINMEVESFESESGTKFIKFIITGQSFIYHQIRSMIGMIAMIINQDYPDNFLESSFFHNVVKIWLAPAHGLFLHRMRFDSYNRKEDIPELVEFNEQDEIRIQEMRKIIEAAVMKDEDVQRIYSEWLTVMKQGKQQDDTEQLTGDGNDG